MLSTGNLQYTRELTFRFVVPDEEVRAGQTYYFDLFEGPHKATYDAIEVNVKILEDWYVVEFLDDRDLDHDDIIRAGIKWHGYGDF